MPESSKSPDLLLQRTASQTFCVHFWMDQARDRMFSVFKEIFFFLMGFIYLFIYLFIYYFIFGCVGSSFLCEGFL